MEFATFENNKKEKTPHGTKFQRTYEITTDEKTGKECLKKNGKVNIYAKIQEQAEDAEIYSIIKKYRDTGDASLLQQREVFYGDFIDVPSDARQINNMLLKAENKFNAIDKDVRAEFENDINVFKKSLTDGTFKERMSKFYKKEEAQQQQAQPIKQENNTTGVEL